ncbi:MAG: DUF2332 domain-containing protein [Nocardioidaceae bacterium]
MDAGSEVSGLAEIFRSHFGHREHLYGVLLDELADDLEAGGPTAQICRHHLDATRDEVIQLRLLAAVFRIVLRGEAPQLAAFYPCLGGSLPAEEAWKPLRPVLADHAHELSVGLDKAPQTNEVGRSACLALGLFEAVRRHGISQVRLLEPGASAGLNLNVDRYRILGQGWAWGEKDGLVLDTQAAGIRPEPVTVLERRGCDLDPLDATSPEDARYLTSFVWPFDLARHARLAAALETAQGHPVVLDRAPASVWVPDQLSHPVGEDRLTVIWTSITQQYWPTPESEAVDDAVSEARKRIPLARITMEGVPPAQTGGGYDIAAHGPQLRVDGEVIARSHHHGLPIVPTAQ